ncbi:MAG: hypothetical protein KDD29_03755 [Flavobacteriales bacterium]|nr:hypothetical protein [Flavobacteriales bacterium]MCB9336344.1 hypothetical protein [Flavobacteriales bacterium]
MKLLNNQALKFIVLIVFTAISINAFSQCKNFTKKEGFPALAPFTHNGQLTSAKFFPGDEAEIEMTFNGGNDYRVLVCSQLQVEVELKVLDKKGNVLHTSNPNDENPHWDFRVKSTQQLIVQIKVAEMEETSTKMAADGCISILVGFRDSSHAEKLLKLNH